MMFVCESDDEVSGPENQTGDDLAKRRESSLSAALLDCFCICIWSWFLINVIVRLKLVLRKH